MNTIKLLDGHQPDLTVKAGEFLQVNFKFYIDILYLIY
jgi:hypothetical protein